MTHEFTAAKHVLVVDDEPEFAAVMRAILPKDRYAVAVAHNCDDALALARKRMPDLITLDIHMPRKSGVFFYRSLMTDREFRNVPVIVVTAVTRDGEMDKIVRRFLEADDAPHPRAYVEKPIDPPSFLELLDEVLASNECG